MRVVTMVFIDIYHAVLSAIALSLAFLTPIQILFAYFHAITILALLYLAVIRIPLVLNWSANLYGSVFSRVFFIHVFAIVSYGVCYYRAPELVPGIETFADALYFSATTWTSLGYGEITPVGGIRLLTSAQALTGLASLAVLASVLWLYCERRLRSSGGDAQAEERYQVALDPAIGVFRPLASEHTRAEQTLRNKLFLNPCRTCGGTAQIEKYYDIVGRTTPLPRFLVRCLGCGRFLKPRLNAYVAAWIWNQTNAQRKG